MRHSALGLSAHVHPVPVLPAGHFVRGAEETCNPQFTKPVPADGDAGPGALLIGAAAFKRAVVAIGQHIEATPEEADEFDYVGAARLLLAEVAVLDGAGTMGFLVTLAQYLAMIRGAGEPIDDFSPDGVSQWVQSCGGAA